MAAALDISTDAPAIDTTYALNLKHPENPLITKENLLKFFRFKHDIMHVSFVSTFPNATADTYISGGYRDNLETFKTVSRAIYDAQLEALSTRTNKGTTPFYTYNPETDKTEESMEAPMYHPDFANCVILQHATREMYDFDETETLEQLQERAAAMNSNYEEVLYLMIDCYDATKAHFVRTMDEDEPVHNHKLHDALLMLTINTTIYLFYKCLYYIYDRIQQETA
jgi:hypothetical protein